MSMWFLELIEPGSEFMVDVISMICGGGDSVYCLPYAVLVHKQSNALE